MIDLINSLIQNPKNGCTSLPRSTVKGFCTESYKQQRQLPTTGETRLHPQQLFRSLKRGWGRKRVEMLTVHL